MNKGHFRYHLRSPQYRLIPGKFGFVAQMNENRLTNRRAPQKISHIDQPFEDEKFNFTKIAEEKELLFTMDYNNVQEDDTLITNVSPVDFCNSLLVPKRRDKLNQVLREDSILKALRIIALSSSPDLRVGFSSLCAHASVNHQHWHVSYLSGPIRLKLETVPAHHVAGKCYEVSSQDYPGECFAFQAELTSSKIDEELSNVAESVHRLTSYLTEQDVAHNVYMTRGLNFVRSSGPYDTIRVFVWARESVYEKQYTDAFNVAVFELSGQNLCYDEKKYESVTEDDVADVLLKTCTNVKENIRPQIVDLFGS